MLRIISFVVAVAAMLAVPVSQADAGSRGHSSGMSMSRSSHVSGMRSSNRIIVGNHRFHNRRFFVGVGAYGLYDTCWRWVPTAYGVRRVWVCDPYSYY